MFYFCFTLPYFNFATVHQSGIANLMLRTKIIVASRQGHRLVFFREGGHQQEIRIMVKY